jgi:hypothetical protein
MEETSMDSYTRQIVQKEIAAKLLKDITDKNLIVTIYPEGEPPASVKSNNYIALFHNINQSDTETLIISNQDKRELGKIDLNYMNEECYIISDYTNTAEMQNLIKSTEKLQDELEACYANERQYEVEINLQTNFTIEAESVSEAEIKAWQKVTGEYLRPEIKDLNCPPFHRSTAKLILVPNPQNAKAMELYRRAYRKARHYSNQAESKEN